jgi:hypothetical protein
MSPVRFAAGETVVLTRIPELQDTKAAAPASNHNLDLIRPSLVR